MSLKNTIVIGLLLASSQVAFASTSVGTIDPSNTSTKVCHDASCTSFGIINFGQTSATAIQITDTAVTGYAWGNEIGWVNMAPTGAGVTVDSSTGLVYGTAWSENSGWINFRPTNSGTISGGIPIGVSISNSGEFYGWAWNGGIYGGWIKFDCSVPATCVKTDWRKLSLRSSSTSTASGLSASYFTYEGTSSPVYLQALAQARYGTTTIPTTLPQGEKPANNNSPILGGNQSNEVEVVGGGVISNGTTPTSGGTKPASTKPPTTSSSTVVGKTIDVDNTGSEEQNQTGGAESSLLGKLSQIAPTTIAAIVVLFSLLLGIWIFIKKYILRQVITSAVQ